MAGPLFAEKIREDVGNGLCVELHFRRNIHPDQLIEDALHLLLFLLQVLPEADPLQRPAKLRGNPPDTAGNLFGQ